MSDLTQADANKLFNDISKAMSDDDSNKLSELLAQETSLEEKQPEVITDADEPQEEVEETATDETQDEEDESADEADNEQQDDDPIAKLTKQIEELRKNQQAISSQSGRVPSIQRRLAEYDKRLSELGKTTSSQTNEKVKPKIDAILKDLDEADPTIANALRNVVEQAISGVDSENHAKEFERIQSLRDMEYADYQLEQQNILLTRYPNAPQVFAGQHWADWKKSQPKHILDLATSDSADAVIMALEIYRNDMIKQHPELAEGETKTETKVDERAQHVEEERNKQKKTSANLDSGKAPVRSKSPNDPEALFKQFSDDIRKEISGK